MTTQLLPITLRQSKTTLRSLIPSRPRLGSNRRMPGPRHWVARLAGVILAILLASPALANELTASVDRTSISIDDRIVLTLRLEGTSPGSGPDLNELRGDFEILSNQSQRGLSIIN